MELTALVPVADGTEELEAVAIVDTLRRAGIEVTVASVEPRRLVTCSRGVRLEADALIATLAREEYDLIALPGGMPGAERLRDCPRLIELLHRHVAGERLLGAICAAPAVVLAPHGLLRDRRATAHPSVFEQLPAARRVDERVVRDRDLITGRGAGAALDLALALVEQLCGGPQRQRVAAAMVARDD